MAINNASNFSADVGKYIQKKTLELTQLQLVLSQFGEKTPLPNGMGTTYNAFRYERVPLPFTTLSEGVAPAGQTMTITQVTGAVAQWGDLIRVTDVAVLTIYHPVFKKAIELAPRAQILVGTTDEHVAWLEQVLADPEVEHTPTGPEDHDHAGHDHHGISTLALPIPGAIDLEELEDQLAELPAEYVRIKGIAATGSGWVAFHRVGLRVSSEPLPGPPDGFVANQGRIVALGRDLRQDRLAACVHAALS